MWTGPRVISKDITLESIHELTKVLQRPPVIWDNIHANDYDQKRVFLGPYEGRSPELIPYLNGVLTNPNCEFEANYVAMHTLAQWSKSMVKKDVILSSSPVSSDIKLETQGDTCSDAVPYQSYEPKQALCFALKDWLLEFSDDCDAVKPKVAKAPPPLVTPPAVTSPQSPDIPLAVAVSLGVTNVNELNELNCFMQPQIVNSFVDVPSSDSETESVDGNATEPMDCAISPGTSPVSSTLETEPALHLMLERDCDFKEEIVDAEMADLETKTSCMTYEELSLLVDMFYTPFQHGSRGLEMLGDFDWLKNMCYVVTDAKCNSNVTSDQQVAAADWHRRADKFYQDVAFFQSVINHVCDSPNRAILFDLYPYIWDMKMTLDILGCYLRWLASDSPGLGCRPSRAHCANSASAPHPHPQALCAC
jgi:protein O-GlcNAcase/histone acetyltransferase